jgi:uncharacterized protein involved in oxidation of intracellular sulfur
VRKTHKQGNFHPTRSFHRSADAFCKLVVISKSSRENINGQEKTMKVLFIISTDDAESSYNAMRLANVAVNKGDEVSVFMLGKGVLYEKSSNDQFNIAEQVNQFEGDFYV